MNTNTNTNTKMNIDANKIAKPDNSYVFRRHEIKYLVNEEQKRMIEEGMKGRMNPDPHGRSTICNVYYDTPDYRLVRTSLEKPVYKEKMRLRSYGQIKSDGEAFLELKKKYEGVVYKRRVSVKDKDAEDYMAGKKRYLEKSQIANEIDYFKDFYGALEPKVYLCYDREAFYSVEDPNLRITFDQNIRWRKTELSLTAVPGGEQILEPGMSLMEIKTAGAIPLWLVAILSKGKIRHASFSKYGTVYRIIENNRKNSTIEMEKNRKDNNIKEETRWKPYSKAYSVAAH